MSRPQPMRPAAPLGASLGWVNESALTFWRRRSIRWKVTLAFAASLALVLTLAGALVYLRLNTALNQSLDQGLQARSDAVGASLRMADGPSVTGPQRLASDESITHVLRPDGSLFVASAYPSARLLTAAQLERAVQGPVHANRRGDPELDEQLRLLAVPVRVDDGSLATYVVVVGTSLDEKNQALASLAVVGTLGLLGALLAGSAAGYAVAGVALRPVERMRQQAEDIQGEPARRLPVPPTRDEISRLGKTLNQMLDRLAASSEAERAAAAKERRFVADASHELRTPLAVMKSELQVALLGEATRNELLDALVSTAEETDRLIQLVEDLLLLARSDEDRMRTDREHVALDELAETVASRQRHRPDAEGRPITVSVEPDLSMALDARMFTQALTNLIDNALRHGRGEIEVAVRRQGTGMRFTVADAGPGLTGEFAEHAFERFSRASPGRTGTGAGLGLAIVKAVAVAHGGHVLAERTGSGALVGLWVPLSPPAEPASPRL